MPLGTSIVSPAFEYLMASRREQSAWVHLPSSWSPVTLTCRVAALAEAASESVPSDARRNASEDRTPCRLRREPRAGGCVRSSPYRRQRDREGGATHPGPGPSRPVRLPPAGRHGAGRRRVDAGGP